MEWMVVGNASNGTNAFPEQTNGFPLTLSPLFSAPGDLCMFQGEERENHSRGQPQRSPNRRQDPRGSSFACSSFSCVSSTINLRTRRCSFIHLAIAIPRIIRTFPIMKLS